MNKFSIFDLALWFVLGFLSAMIVAYWLTVQNGEVMSIFDNSGKHERRNNMKVVTFTVSVEVEDDGIANPSTEERKLFEQMLSDMEEVVGKSPFTLDDSGWEIVA